MKIAVDAHGGDFGIAPNIEGSLLAAPKLGHEILLVGRESEIKSALRKYGAENPPHIRIIHAPDIAEMDAEPVQECKKKPLSSIMVCADMVAQGQADAVVSAGNSGATLVASFLNMKRLKGVSRPAIAAPFPTLRGISVLIDGGANTDCKPLNLVQFAMMGTVYAKHVFKIPNPTVGILSVGEEETKGNALVLETIPLLKKSNLNFCGTLEGRDIAFGTADVLVCDGFVGNLCLKAGEGTAKAVFQMLKSEILKSWRYKLGAALLKPALMKIKRRTSDEEYGGAPLLGVNGSVIIAHGRTSATAIFNSIRVAGELVSSGVNKELTRALDEMKGFEDKEDSTD